MGMYIIGKEPDRCGVCPCFHAENPMYCQAVIADVQKPRIGRPYAKGRQEWCPLISVTEPHGRLIDADALLKYEVTLPIVGEANAPYLGGVPCVYSSYIKNATTIIEAEEGE